MMIVFSICFNVTRFHMYKCNCVFICVNITVFSYTCVNITVFSYTRVNVTVFMCKYYCVFISINGIGFSCANSTVLYV